MPTAPAQGATTTPVASSGTSLTQSDIRTMARKAADYITFNCNGISEGFEITYKGYIAFIDYEAKECSDERQESATVPAVWDAEGKEHPDISEALQVMLN